MLRALQTAICAAFMTIPLPYCQSQESKRVSELIQQSLSNDANNAKAGLKELQSLARDGNIEAMLAVATCFRKGHGADQDLRLAHLASLKAAEKGSVEGMYETALCLLDGKGVPKDLGRGLVWLTKAAEQNHHASLERLSEEWIQKYDRYGKGAKEVLKWSQRGAKLGIAKCLRISGQCFEFGIGTDVDPSKAFEMYGKASKLDDTRATVLLADCYKAGFGTDVDAKRAIQLLQAAATKEDPYAIHYLAMGLDELVVGKSSSSAKWDPLGLYKPSTKASIQSEYQRKVVELLEKASSLGHVESMAVLAKKYAEGQGCEKNLTRAVELADKSSQAGNADAMCFLGDCYMLGQGVKANPKKGASLYLRAANLGAADAQFKYGKCLASGTGVRSNFAECQQWMATSSANGNEDATAFLRRLRENEMAQVRDWLDSMFTHNWIDDAISERREEGYRESERLDEMRRQRNGY